MARNRCGVILPGMCYRYEQASVRYDIQFNQGRRTCGRAQHHVRRLKGTLTEFARRAFGERPVRFYAIIFRSPNKRADGTYSAIICNGAGCQMCKYTGFLEILDREWCIRPSSATAAMIRTSGAALLSHGAGTHRDFALTASKTFGTFGEMICDSWNNSNTSRQVCKETSRQVTRLPVYVSTCLLRGLR